MWVARNIKIKAWQAARLAACPFFSWAPLCALLFQLLLYLRKRNHWAAQKAFSIQPSVPVPPTTMTLILASFLYVLNYFSQIDGQCIETGRSLLVTPCPLGWHRKFNIFIRMLRPPMDFCNKSLDDLCNHLGLSSVLRERCHEPNLSRSIFDAGNLAIAQIATLQFSLEGEG